MAGDLLFPEHIYRYLLANSLREAPVLKKLREETASHAQGRMQIGPEQGQFMALLVQLMGARRTLEVGVFTVIAPWRSRWRCPPMAASWLAISARNIPRSPGATGKRPGSTQDRPEDRPGDRNFPRAAESGSSRDASISRSSMRTRPATRTITSPLLELMRPGGLIMVDNVLWSGQVADRQRPTPTQPRFGRSTESSTRIRASRSACFR